MKKILDYIIICYTIPHSYTGLGKAGPKGTVALTLSFWLLLVIYICAPNVINSLLNSYMPQMYWGFFALNFIIYIIILLIYRKAGDAEIHAKINALSKAQKRGRLIMASVLLLFPIAILVAILLFQIWPDLAK